MTTNNDTTAKSCPVDNCAGRCGGTKGCAMCKGDGRPGYMVNAYQWVHCWGCNQQAPTPTPKGTK